MERAERSDAARNRQAILLAAQTLFAEAGERSVSMDDIAAAAGVGKGTLFRRFGDRDGLLLALFEQITEDWERGALERLGDRAVPAEQRIVEFSVGLFDGVVLPARPVLRAMTSSHFSPRRFEQHLLWQARLAETIREFRPELDANFIAHTLLVIQRADYIDLLVERIGMSLDEVRSGLMAFTYATITGQPIPPDVAAMFASAAS